MANQTTKTIVARGTARALRRAAGIKPAIIDNGAQRVATAMRNAFLNANIVIADSGRSDVVDTILNSAKQNAGNNKVGRGWTANLSAATVRKLTNEGVFA